MLPASRDTATIQKRISLPHLQQALYLFAAGVEVLEIIETQLLHRQSDGSLEVESTPVLAAPGASKFTTHALFSMSETVNGRKSCKVQKRVDEQLFPCISHTQRCKALASNVVMLKRTR